MASDETTGRRPLEVAPTLALIARLQSSRRLRDLHGLFFVEGVRNFVAAVDQGLAIEALIYSERLLIAPLARKLVRRLKRAGVPYVATSPEQYRTVSRAERASGVGAILRQPIGGLPQAITGRQRCWIALSQVRSPGNLGTLVRTAAAVGASGFILLEDQIDPFDPAIVRASMGALFGQALVRTTTAQLGRWVQQHHVSVVGASPDGAALYTQVRYQTPVVLMLGEERAGLTPEQRALCDQLVRIPMVAGADSLNLGVAGSLLLYAILGSDQDG
jgi:TrmH family RNA methyltransferase